MADDRPRFTGIDLVGHDLEATMAFYRLLGVDIPDEAIWRSATGPHHVHVGRIADGAELEIHSPALAAAYNAGYGADPRAAATVLGFGVASREAVDALHDRLVAAGHPSRQPPFDAFWGARYAIVADPDGRDVGIMSPADQEHRNPPPDV
jgi:uncharacterized glyoxalase superfamily protein PhnB